MGSADNLSARQGFTVSVVNPARTKGYAQATMQCNKTDKLNSAVIASFCATHHPTAWQPLSEAQRRLRALVRHREDLLQTRLQQQNRLRDTTDTLVLASRQAELDAIAQQLEAVERTMNEHLAAHESGVADGDCRHWRGDGGHAADRVWRD